jgi:hypothetical protein
VSSCSLASSVGSDDMMMGSPSPILCERRRGRGAEDVRSQSRRPNPSVVLRMPKDNDEAVMCFSTRRRVDEGDDGEVMDCFLGDILVRHWMMGRWVDGMWMWGEGHG